MKPTGTELDKLVAWGVDYPYAYPIWFGPFLSILRVHHPDYTKTVLSSTGIEQGFSCTLAAIFTNCYIDIVPPSLQSQKMILHIDT